MTLTRSSDEILVVITDDGKGFDVSAALSAEQAPFGLLSMQERVRLLGGEVGFSSTAGKGTVVRVHVPIGQAEGRS